MNVVILGGKTKFGAHLAERMSSQHQVLALGKPEIDFSNDWVPTTRQQIEQKFGDPNCVKVVVVNVFDYNSERLWVQANVLQTMWEIYAQKECTIIVIGSMTWHDPRQVSLYTKAKKELHSRCYVYSQSRRVARLRLIEPNMLENRIGYGHGRQPTVLTLDELVGLVDLCIHSHLPYLHIAACGKHVSDFKQMNTKKE